MRVFGTIVLVYSFNARCALSAYLYEFWLSQLVRRVEVHFYCVIG